MRLDIKTDKTKIEITNISKKPQDISLSDFKAMLWTSPDL